MIDGKYTLKEAMTWLTERGFVRSEAWYRSMITHGKIKYQKEIGRIVIEQNELEKILKKKPCLKVVVSAILIFLLSTSTGRTEPAWEGIVIHHSNSTHMTLEECNAWHNDRGWQGCGYNFIIEPDGSLITARGTNKIGAHARGFNSRFLGIVIVGNGAANEIQFRTLRGLVQKLRKDFNIHRIVGHRDVGQTECPGKILYQQIKAIQ